MDSWVVGLIFVILPIIGWIVLGVVAYLIFKYFFLNKARKKFKNEEKFTAAKHKFV